MTSPPLSVTLKILLSILFLATWNQPSLAQEQPRRPSSKQYDEFAVKAVTALVEKNEAEFTAMLTTGVVSRTENAYGKDAMRRIIEERFIPFFEDFEKLDPNVTTTKTKDGDGNEGIAFFRMFITKKGDEKPFVVYVIEEEGTRLRVANVLINTRFKDVNKKPGESK